MVGPEVYPKFKAAAVQAGQVLHEPPYCFDVKATLEKAISYIDQAGKNGARLIVFPECWLPSYPHRPLYIFERNLGIIWAELLKHSIEVPGAETEELGKAARRANAYVVMGINERDRKYQGRMYNSLLYIGPRGEVMGVHRKISNTIYERLFHTPGDGGTNLKAIFPTEVGIIGGSICGEHCQHLLLYNWIMQGLQVHCSAWPGHSASTLKTIMDVQTRALCTSGGVFAVLSAAYLPPQDRPKVFLKSESPHDQWCGGSGIIDPYGNYIAGPVYDQETIVYGDIDLSEVMVKKHSVSPTGIYSRWDILSLAVRQHEYEPLIPLEDNDMSERAATSERLKALEEHVKELERRLASTQ
ncbi:MAG: aliphatic nitrilase [Dehalococcoidia bacterium]|nr:aliphatic nitrilase [Dehalococcoidia bacterium]